MKDLIDLTEAPIISEGSFGVVYRIGYNVAKVLKSSFIDIGGEDMRESLLHEKRMHRLLFDSGVSVPAVGDIREVQFRTYSSPAYIFPYVPGTLLGQFMDMGVGKRYVEMLKDEIELASSNRLYPSSDVDNGVNSIVTPEGKVVLIDFGGWQEL